MQRQRENVIGENAKVVQSPHNPGKALYFDAGLSYKQWRGFSHAGPPVLNFVLVACHLKTLASTLQPHDCNIGQPLLACSKHTCLLCECSCRVKHVPRRRLTFWARVASTSPHPPWPPTNWLLHPGAHAEREVWKACRLQGLWGCWVRSAAVSSCSRSVHCSEIHSVWRRRDVQRGRC